MTTHRESLHKEMVCVVFGVLLALSFPAEAQQPKKIPRIGYLTLSSSSPSPSKEAFRDGLRQLGYIEGQSIHVDYRYAEGNLDRLPNLAAEVDLFLWGRSIINLVVECPHGKYFGSLRAPRNVCDRVLEFLKQNHGRKLREVMDAEIDISDVIH